jgi:hypothetical protein
LPRDDSVIDVTGTFLVLYEKGNARRLLGRTPNMWDNICSSGAMAAESKTVDRWIAEKGQPCS